jgi:hypothetical protein
MRIIALSLPLLFSTSAFAQPGEPSTQPNGRPGPASADEWSVTLGVAPVVSPAWEGADDVILSVFPEPIGSPIPRAGSDVAAIWRAAAAMTSQTAAGSA